MTRVFGVLPEIDAGFQRPFGYMMIVMFTQMLLSLFSYKSILITVIVLYSEYICIINIDNVKSILSRQYTSLMSQSHKHGTDDDETDGYDEGSDITDDDSTDGQILNASTMLNEKNK